MVSRGSHFITRLFEGDNETFFWENIIYNVFYLLCFCKGCFVKSGMLYSLFSYHLFVRGNAVDEGQKIYDNRTQMINLR